ncbi:MAG: bifunctional 2-polyprenyl-6-hydroxyphenol methylase/3-demethylubiquinol 3-O-methyltransferase UbiG [Beijerinckiaceae bacterium]|nr:bifunctional 2-polyprenyl-6-hydroxyphenol methylase/3-demethylubiquinol 3-O-methyltransferase UbiG [Beijerinckiaceae bacterium]MCZ8300740.1 bifunctional 2-polyprenyl-6-hydroxyphenol methylase/3-demethylubiquinol 3-O-methyltransferase UbiG [Beijerinckiaceae bacterium]
MPDRAASVDAGNLDPAEIGRFNALAETWWDPNGPMKPLHRLNPTRLTFLRRVLATHFGRDTRALDAFSGLSLLDLGCGAGLVAEPMARMGFMVTGLDLAEDNIRVARQHAEAGGLSIEYRALPVEALEPDAPFDVITMLEVVEHVPDVEAFMQAAARHLRPGGILVASTLNRTLKSWGLAIVGAEYVLRWLPRGTHDWKRFVTPDELDTHFIAAGLTPTTRSGMVFQPLTGAWQLSEDCDVNYLAVAVKPGA